MVYLMCVGCVIVCFFIGVEGGFFCIGNWCDFVIVLLG